MQKEPETTVAFKEDLTGELNPAIGSIDKNPIKMEEESEESDWSDLEEIKELRRQFKKLVLEEPNKKKKKKGAAEITDNKMMQPIENSAQREERYAVKFRKEEDMIRFGTLECIVEGKIIIQNTINLILELNNVVITKSNHIIGKIEEIMGKVESPKYIISMDPYTKDLIKKGQLKEDDNIYVQREEIIVLPEEKIESLKSVKGSRYNSSRFESSTFGMNSQMFHSDDEKESEHASMQKRKEMTQLTKRSYKNKFQKFKNMDAAMMSIPQYVHPAYPQIQQQYYYQNVPQPGSYPYMNNMQYPFMMMPQQYNLSIPANYNAMMSQVDKLYMGPKEPKQNEKRENK